MGKKEILSLIDECYDGLVKINNTFYGCERIDANEEEERFYKSKFRELNVKRSIVSEIYTIVRLSGKKEGLKEIKKNLGSRLITK